MTKKIKATPLITETDFALAIKGTHGIVSEIADNLGCSVQTVRQFIRKNKGIARVLLKDERKEIVDKAEKALIKGIERGDPQLIKFALKTLGKDRGYEEKAKVEVSGEIIHKAKAYIGFSPDQWQEEKRKIVNQDADQNSNN